MNFFQQLFNQIDGIPVQMTFQRKNGKITISVLPTTTASIAPAIVTGTPEELEVGFFEAIAAPISDAKGLQVQLDAMKASLESAKEQKKEQGAKPKKAGTNSKTELEKDSDGKNSSKPIKADTPDLFAGA